MGWILKRLNVVKVGERADKKAALLAQGFVQVVNVPEEKLSGDNKNVKKNARNKGSD